MEISQFLHILVGQLQRNSGYLARTEIDSLLEGISKNPKRLEPFGFKVYSQNDEDGIIQEIFNRIGLNKGYFVEIGLQDGLECNTLFLIHKGWAGVWIEGDAGYADAIRRKFDSILGRRLLLKNEMVSAENINDILGNVGIPEDIDLLSLDIDGNDIYVMEKIRHRPKVICIEYNSKFPPPLVKQQIYSPGHLWGGTDYFGASLAAIQASSKSMGYSLVGTNITGSNAFLVRDDLCGSLFATDRPIAELYNPPRYWLQADHFANVGHRADFGEYVDLIAGSPVLERPPTARR